MFVLIDRSGGKPRYFLRTNRQGPFTIHVGVYSLEQARTYPTRSAAVRAAKSRRHYTVEKVTRG